MSDQLELAVGDTVSWGHPEKALHEAAIWASLAASADRWARA